MFACLYLPPPPAHRSAMSQPAGRDRPAAGTLLGLAREFSPRVEWHHDGLVVLDASGLERLLGDPGQVGRELRTAAANRGLGVRIALAPTRAAALILAHARAGLTVVSTGQAAEAVAAVPLGVLGDVLDGLGAEAGEKPEGATHAGRRSTGRRREDQAPGSARHYHMAPGRRMLVQQLAPGGEMSSARGALTTLARWGVKTLGDLAALPAPDLFERLGETGLGWQRLARAEDSGPLVPAIEQEPFAASLELEWPLDALEPLSFVLSRLLDPLCARLERSELGAAFLEVDLWLVTRVSHARRLQLPAPMRDPRVLRTLLLLDLESHPPPAAIDRVTVRLEPAPGRVVQHSLLLRALPSPEQLSTLLARVRALMGEGRCGTPSLLDTHQPGAFALSSGPDEKRIASAIVNRQSSILNESPRCVLRRCRPPTPARVALEHGRPVRVATGVRGLGGVVRAAAGPWRSSGQWWHARVDQRDRAAAATVRRMSAASPFRPPDRDPEAMEPTDAGGVGIRSTPAAWHRDEWDVALGDGSVLRIFQDHLRGGRWFIDGIVD